LHETSETTNPAYSVLNYKAFRGRRQSVPVTYLAVYQTLLLPFFFKYGRQWAVIVHPKCKYALILVQKYSVYPNHQPTFNGLLDEVTARHSALGCH